MVAGTVRGTFFEGITSLDYEAAVMVVDSHVHAWGAPSDANPWTNGALVEYTDRYTVDIVYTAEKLLNDMNAFGVDEAVVVGHAVCDFDNNSYVTTAVDRHDRLYGVALVDPLRTDAASRLRELISGNGMIGVRLAVNSPHGRLWRDFDSEATWLREAIDQRTFFRAAMEMDAVVHLMMAVDQVDLIEELVSTYPEITFLVDHLACPDPARPPTDPPFSRVLDLAAYEHVGVKVSSVSMLSTEDFPYFDVHDHVRAVVDAFGRKRVLWGSDFPNSSIAASYDESVEWLEHVDGLSRGDRRWLSCRAFDRFVLG